MREKSHTITQVVSLLTLCAVLAACDTQEASTTIESLYSPAASPISDLGMGAIPSIPPTERLETVAASSHTPEETYSTTASKTPIATVARPSHTSTPSPTFTPPVVPGLPEICQPYPSDIYGIGQAQNGDAIVYAICKGEYASFPSPVGKVAFLDYTPITGRLAYSQSLMSSADQTSEEGGDLWIFDFWTGRKTKWLDGGVVNASWAPIRDSIVKKQFLAVLQIGGSLDLGTEPNSFTPLAKVDNVCWFSWSPLGDQIAYVRDCHEISDYYCYSYTAGTSYIIKIHEGQPRKVAEGTNGVPIWALDYQALIIPGSPMRVYKLDESKSFPLSLPNGEFLDGERMRGYLWSPSNRLLHMEEYGCFDKLGNWVAELSEELSKVTNFTIAAYAFDFKYGSNGEIHINSPQGRLNYMGKILSLDKQSLRMSNVMTEYNEEGFGDVAVVFSKETLFLDAQGNRTDFAALEKGMYIDFLGTALSPDTLTLIAARIQIIGPTSMDVIYQAKIYSLFPDHQHATIEITSPKYELIYSIYRGLEMTSETQVFDREGNAISIQDLQEGMVIEIVGPSLPSDPLSIVASTIKILDE
jgi:hypothetical protein